jgi:NitT/TauT family transport system substrate-binding protein
LAIAASEIAGFSIWKYPNDVLSTNKNPLCRGAEGNRMQFYRSKLMCLTTAAALLATAAPALAQALDRVSVRADVFFYGAHAPIMVGIVDGIYKKHGIDVTFATGRGSSTTIQTVANGSDQFGFADAGALVRLTAQGLHAKQIVGMMQTGSYSIISFPESNILKPKDLEGKTTGFAPGGATDQIFPAFAKMTGVDTTSIKSVSVDPQARDSLFLIKRIDFDIALAAAQFPILEERCKCKLNLMRFSDYGLRLMSNGIIASDKLIADNPDLVRRFAAATVEASQIAIANPEHAVDDFLQYAPNAGFSRKVVADQWNEAIELAHSPRTKDKPFGVMDPLDWQETIDVLSQYLNIPQGAVAPDKVFTNAYLPQ